ncbi:MAG: hypothetical protein ACE15D_18955, partial [Candidatus Eisenbacteria bacterium]
ERGAASATGERGAASATGWRGAASATGKDSVALATGFGGRALACSGSAIVLCYRNDDGSIRHVRSGIAGRDGIKADTWYALGEDGDFVEVEA